MRLVCPNCDAQYEVDEKVIPENGRDVQCSNCGNTWFQTPEHLDADLADEMGYEIAPDGAGDLGQAPLPEHPPKPDFETDEDQFHDVEPNEVAPDFDEAQDDSGDDDDTAWGEPHVDDAHSEAADTPAHEPEYSYDDSDSDDDEEKDEGEDEEALAPAMEARARPSIDDSIREMLREEQEFSAPPASTEPFEVQTDLGLEEAEIATDQAMREKMARLRGLDPADPALAAGSLGVHAKRRDLLPDIEEINSTLSASSERDADGTVPDAQTRLTRVRRGTSRTVFALFIIVASLLVVLYIFAPAIANAVPALAPLMETYVNAANVFRAWLDGGMSALSSRLNALLSQLNS
ncbi:zinc-ribbon domain-containing protein [Celeribacter sp.]|uniref:zinc-ribbon domain-containing protein n=1 Tax=Celeribacter sp. TaxID=1890673 RepID=UPI003A9416FB